MWLLWLLWVLLWLRLGTVCLWAANFFFVWGGGVERRNPLGIPPVVGFGRVDDDNLVHGCVDNDVDDDNDAACFCMRNPDFRPPLH